MSGGESEWLCTAGVNKSYGYCNGNAKAGVSGYIQRDERQGTVGTYGLREARRDNYIGPRANGA